LIDKKDIGFLEAIDTVLDFIVEKILQRLSEYYTVDDDLKDFVELNRFERSNIILANFYQSRSEFDLSSEDKLIELIYDSLNNPYLMDGTNIEEIQYLRENTIDSIDDDRYFFNNGIFSWFDYSDFDNNYKKELKEIISNIIRSNTDNKIYKLNEIDVNLYQAIISNPDLLRTLNWRTFEKLLADILEKFEYEIELKKGTKDGGVDIIAIKNYTPFGPNRYLVQAKRWKNKVGVEPVRSLIWAQNEYKATKSCLATTTTFTKGAWDLAKRNRWQVELKDYERILEWIKLTRNN
jgi:HJR/Mrr/RecB family endonuclease